MVDDSDRVMLSADFLASVWQQRQKSRSPGTPIRALACDRAGQWLVTAGDDQKVRIWSVADGRLIQQMSLPVTAEPAGQLHAVAIRPDGDWIVAGGGSAGTPDQHMLYLIERASGAILGQLGPLPEAVSALDIDPTGQRLAVGFAGTAGVWLFDLTQGDEIARDDEFGASVQTVRFDAHGGNAPYALAASSHDQYVRLYDQDLEILGVVPLGGPASGLAFGPRRLAVGFQEQQRLEWLNFDEQDSLAITDPYDDGGDLSAVALLADGRLVAGGSWANDRGQVCLWVIAPVPGAAGMAWPAGGAEILALVALPTGGVVATNSDGELICWKSDGQILWRVQADLSA